jgi:hypothetical protein
MQKAPQNPSGLGRLSGRDIELLSEKAVPMARPFFNSSITELEAAFTSRRHDLVFLNTLAEELRHRTTDKARKLREAVERARAQHGSAVPPNDSGASQDPNRPQREPPPEENRSPRDGPRNPPPEPPPPIPLPPISNRPEEILSTWTALEVLSPPTFRRPEDLAPGDSRGIASLQDQKLPWERGELSRPNFRLYYQVVLGSIPMQPAVEQLIRRFGDSRVERPTVKGNAILAVVIVDKAGRLVESPAVSISSFGWGVMAALRGDLTDLARWPEIEPDMVRRVEKNLLSFSPAQTDEEKRSQPLTRKALLSAFHTLLRETGLPPEMIEAPSFAIRSYVYFKDSNPPEPLLLNSFFLTDLSLSRSFLKANKAPDNLKRYLGAIAPQSRSDLLQDRHALERSLAPAVTPTSRWPSPGGYPLALLQQSAVNLAFSETQGGGILGINGPPGTGKSTLLRDILAGVVTARAEAMCAFDDPESAFKNSGERLKAGNAWLHLYKVDSRIRGFEMVVASSNNRAVENVSRELPATSSIEANGLDYFKLLSDALHEQDTWGLAAAVLGNGGNRTRFKNTFWWNEDLGMKAYLLAATGANPQVTERDSETGQSRFRDPKIVSSQQPPPDHNEAVRRWKKARDHFNAALKKSRERQSWLEAFRQDLLKLDSLIEEARIAKAALDASDTELLNATESIGQARARLSSAETAFRAAERTLAEHMHSRPGFLARKFCMGRAPAWMERNNELRSHLNQARRQLAADTQKVSGLEEILRAMREEQSKAKLRHDESLAALTGTRARLAKAKQHFGITMPDAEFYNHTHGERQRTTLWYTEEALRARSDLFKASMKLHRAFIDAAAKPLRHNLSVTMNLLSGGSLPSAQKQALITDMWATLFLVVPLISTTFASVSKMFGKLNPESLGWLFVDEAGQALPQAAVGAIIRSRRVVMVGDPAQIEPVVMLPDALTNAISRRFGVDPDVYTAPAASAQTLADSASSFASEFQTQSGSRTVGVPLLVHRRCADPMFSISNAIAYSGLMVQAKTEKTSAIRAALGEPRWIHVEGGGEDKWSADEGAEVLRLLGILAHEHISPDLYIVTPFVMVADRLRQLIRDSGILRRFIPEDEIWKWAAERVGTVHTVQGREAEAVIFVLGAPHAGQTGARGWAGGRPNLLNVALTRAKEAVYVIGNRALWREAGHFRDLDLFL